MNKRVYLVISRGENDQLINEVNKMLNKGWECVGGIQVSTSNHQSTFDFGALYSTETYHQSMICTPSKMSKEYAEEALEIAEYYSTAVEDYSSYIS